MEDTYYARNRERVLQYKKDRYKNDPDFRDQVKRKARERNKENYKNDPTAKARARGEITAL